MKKILSLILILCLCIGTVSVLSSCDEGIIHTHSVSDELEYDSDFHWYPCESEACNTKIEKEEHSFTLDDSDSDKPVEVCEVCGYEKEVLPEVPEHEHVFKTEYSNSENFHWYACETENCTEMSEREEHSYLAPEITQEPDAIIRVYTCQTCGYSFTDRTEISSVIEGEAAWSQAFDNLELVNFSMRVVMEYHYSEEYNYTHINECEITEDSAHYCIPDQTEFYTKRLEDGSCVTYNRENQPKDSTTPFTKLADTSDSYLKGAQVETVLKISFADHYDKFVYNAETGEYTYDGEIEAKAYKFNGEPYDEQIICFNNVVKVADGEIIHIACDYKFGSEEPCDYSFVYYNIGITEVVIPDSVINNALEQETQPAE